MESCIIPDKFEAISRSLFVFLRSIEQVRPLSLATVVAILLMFPQQIRFSRDFSPSLTAALEALVYALASTSSGVDGKTPQHTATTDAHVRPLPDDVRRAMEISRVRACFYSFSSVSSRKNFHPFIRSIVLRSSLATSNRGHFFHRLFSFSFFSLHGK